ncbi:MAG: hypothetical protein KC912_14625 [Proteobacteria bacterium]|nr:hypothetical protein [Pseudomonadota bacterium]
MRTFIGLLVLLSGCWNGEPSSLTTGETAFTPDAGTLAGWRVQTFDMGNEDDAFACPDGSGNHFYIVYPDDAEGPQATAVLLHSGAFDWVVEPDPTDPLAGDHFSTDNRLSGEFSAGKVFATLGMYPDIDEEEASTGALALALAERRVTLVIPGNCWGDMWHNRAEDAENDTVTDGFLRRGGDAAAYAWRFASEPGFPTAQRITPPVAFDTDALYLVGLDEGGRGVTELLADGASPAGVLLDSTADDLAPYYADTVLYEPVLVGLNRMFPDGESSTVVGSLHDTATPLPDRIAYLYSSLDGSQPSGSHEAAVTRLETAAAEVDGPTVWINDTLQATHVGTASDTALAGQAADFLLDR